MKLLHIGPQLGPHLPLVQGLCDEFPHENSYISLPQTRPGRSIFRTVNGFIRKAVRRNRPSAVVVHWDKGIYQAVRALWPGVKPILAHRYTSDPLPAGTYKRALYKKLSGYVVDSEYGARAARVVARREDLVHLFRRQIEFQSEPRVRRPGDPLIVGIPLCSMHQARPALAMLKTAGREFFFEDGMGQPWSHVLKMADVFLFFEKTSLTYPQNLIQASLTGRLVAAPEQGHLEIEGVRWYPRMVPNFLADMVNGYQKKPPEDLPSSGSTGQPLSDLMEIYGRILR